jgi:hypothetical protein
MKKMLFDIAIQGITFTAQMMRHGCKFCRQFTQFVPVQSKDWFVPGLVTDLLKLLPLLRPLYKDIEKYLQRKKAKTTSKKKRRK